jgi:hypothetical protein
VCQREERLYFLRHIYEGGRNAGLELSCCLGTVTPFEFVLTGRKYERLFRTTNSFSSGGSYLPPELLRRKCQIALDSVLAHIRSPYFWLWRVCGATCSKAPQCSSFVVGHLPPKIPESAPLPLCSNTSRITSTRAALLCDSCLQLSSVVANCRLLLTFGASCFFVANCCRLSACPKLSHSLPICPKLSQTVPSCPSNDFLHSGSAAVHKILSYFFLFRGSLVSEGFASADSKGKHGAVPGSPMAIGPKLAHCSVVVELVPPTASTGHGGDLARRRSQKRDRSCLARAASSS